MKSPPSFQAGPDLRRETFGALYAWEFEKDGQALRVRVDGQLTFNNSNAMIDEAVCGLGIAFLSEDSPHQIR